MYPPKKSEICEIFPQFLLYREAVIVKSYCQMRKNPANLNYKRVDANW